MEKLRGEVESSKSHMLQVIVELLNWLRLFLLSSPLGTDLLDHLVVQEYSSGE